MAETLDYVSLTQPIFPPPAGAPKGPPPIPYPENFAALAAEEKYQFFKKLTLQTAGKPFASADAAETYRRRAQRWFDVVELKEPDQVPNYLLVWGFLATYTGITQADGFYDIEKTAEATIRFHEQFQPDYAMRVPAMPGHMYEKLGIKMMRWPGGGRPDALGDDTPFQYVEGEYMKRGEYRDLIRNPDAFLLRAWYPRVFEKLQGLSFWPTPYTGVEPFSVPAMLMPFARGPVRQALDTLLAAADSCLAEMTPAFLAPAEIQRRWGAPGLVGGLSLAPFDIIGDTLRGTTGVMLDMYRQPDALLEACDALVPAAVQMAVDGAMASGRPFVFIPLHKGDDTFMSEEQFARFYWPSFKKHLQGIIDAGLIPFSFVEGIYNKKLDVIAGSDLPKGRTVWLFDRTDMKTAKEKLGGKACIGGNVPASLFAAGTAEQVDQYCKELMEQVAPGGGFFLAPGAVIDHASPETIHAFVQSTKKYGVY